MFYLTVLKFTLLGCFRIYRNIAIFLFHRWKMLTIYDRAFLVTLLFQTAFALQKWKEYSIELTPEETLYHGINSNDYFQFFILLALTGLPYLVRMFKTSSLSTLHWSDYIRLAALLGILIYFFLNLAQPQRITVARDAQYTIWFYLFGGGLLLLIALASLDYSKKIGILGIKAMPRIRVSGR